MRIKQRIEQLGLALPPVSPSAGAYLSAVQTGNLVFVSGHIARKEGKVWQGRLGDNLSIEDGQSAARLCVLDIFSTLQDFLGDLDKIQRVVKLMSLVNATPAFTEPHLVTNGASELISAIFGEAGAHARSAFCVTQLPMGACVEIELIVAVG